MSVVPSHQSGQNKIYLTHLCISINVLTLDYIDEEEKLSLTSTSDSRAVSGENLEKFIEKLDASSDFDFVDLKKQGMFNKKIATNKQLNLLLPLDKSEA